MQGGNPQGYVGEVGTYYHDFLGNQGPCPGDPNQSCFNTCAANNATGAGVFLYYFLGGPGVSGQSPGAWGQAQAQQAVADANAYFGAWEGNHAMGMDIEPAAAGQYGWTGNAANDRAVFNGFFNYIKSIGWTPFVYSSGTTPNGGSWTIAMGSGSYSSIPYTVTLTYETHNWCSWPSGGQFTNNPSGKNADWFGGSGYQWRWQFGGCGQDWDMLYTPNDP